MAVCPHCGMNLEQDTLTICPSCGGGLHTRGEPPQVSAIAGGDAELLRKGIMRPPSRLGTTGRIGRFEILKPLGSGGMADVFLATEPLSNMPVALKLLKRHLAENPRIAEAFRNEARCMSQISHPGILKVLDVSPPDQGPFFVMPFVAGGSLDSKLRAAGKPSHAETMALALELADALAHAHRKGLIHCDLKPANVLLGADGRALLTDFGLARSLTGNSIVRAQGHPPEGTPAYMSPGVAAGEVEDTRCDIYSFGALMYELLTGRPPYQGKSVDAVLAAVRAGPPRPIAAVNPSAPKGLVAIAEACMARTLRHRYATMDDVVEDLKRVADGKPPVGPHGTGAPRKKIVRLTLAAVTTALVVAAGGLGWLMARNDISHADSVPALRRRAAALYEAGDYTRAGLAYDELLRRAPTDAQALFGAGKTALAQDRPRVGTDYLRQAQDAAPADARIARALFDQLLKIGHTEAARRTLDVWLEADPTNEEALKLQAEFPAWHAPLPVREAARPAPGLIPPPNPNERQPQRERPPPPRVP